MLQSSVRVSAARQTAHGICRYFSSTSAIAADYTHTVIGAGVVGLATARALASRPGTSTLLVERNTAAGTETSSRNSEVIHAGLYYPADSLKTRLCLRGKGLMYELCSARGIPHSRIGKWVVAQNAEQAAELEGVAAHAAHLDVPVRWVGEEERAERLRTEGVRAAAAALHSPSTGIVDSHALMGFLEEDVKERGGDVAVATRVVGIERDAAGGFRIRLRTGGSAGASGEEAEETEITTETLVNAAGLSAAAVSNMLLPPDRHFVAYYAKGTYFSYTGKGPKPSILVYPAPQPGAGGLGTHLTLDMAGQLRFGPDVEWIDSPDVPGAYAPSEAQLPAALDTIETYLPGLERDKVKLDYCGIRPKLGEKGAVGKGKGFQDFVIREEEGFPGFVNLVGIESPGLTSCLAIAEEVEGIFYGKR